MIYQLSTLWLLLTAAAAREQYNEVPDVGNEVLSQDSEVDAVAVEPRAEEARLQDLLLFQLIRARLREDLEARRRLHKEQAEFEDMENSVMKRVAPERNVRPQRWWKTKKGRGVGTQMCYFKLCAFRNPSV